MNSKFYEDLQAKREKAREDKCDLFDFYNDNWDVLIEKLKILEKFVEAYHKAKTYQV